MAFNETDPILYMQIQIANLYRKTKNMSIDEFNALDRKIKLLEYIAVSYEPFHLTGEQGILEEVENYVREIQTEVQYNDGDL